MLGRDVVTVLAESSEATVTAASHGDLDVTDAAAARAAVAGHQVVLNTAAYTDVDRAEIDEATATAVNGRGVEVLARACAAAGARLITVSTDYVFGGDTSASGDVATDGRVVGFHTNTRAPRDHDNTRGPGGGPSGAPYSEDHPVAPVNAYGRSKLLGERAALRWLPDTGYVVRTAWLYGEHGQNFVATMLRVAAAPGAIDVVDDQRGQPTWSWDLARQLVSLGGAALAGQAPPGVYHGTASGETTWHGLALAVLAGAGHDPARVRPTASHRFSRPARRPAYSVLGHHRWKLAGVAPQPHWTDSLRAALDACDFGRGVVPCRRGVR